MKRLNWAFCPASKLDLKDIDMKKLRSFALYALVTPVITLGAASLLAQQANDQNMDREEYKTQREHGTTEPTPSVTEGVASSHRTGKSDSQSAKDHQRMRNQSGMENRGYISSVPANGMQASDLIGSKIKTSSDNSVGSINDLVIDANGQVIAVVVEVGRTLGMGEKVVAIGWDDVTTSCKSDEQELQVDATREELRAAPEFAERS